VPPRFIKASIQQAFETWGLPLALRVDNGAPWGTSKVVPSALALWLSGLGIHMIYGRPACSTDNAIVERDHGVLAQWAEPQRQPHFAALREQLEWAANTQRERYRAPQHLTRAEAFPALYTNPRTYQRQRDAQLWDKQRAACFLSSYRFHRKVEQNGRISLLANTYSVGQTFRRRTVTIQLDPHTYEWVLCDEYGNEIRRHRSKELDYDLISNLQLAKRHKS